MRAGNLLRATVGTAVLGLALTVTPAAQAATGASADTTAAVSVTLTVEGPDGTIFDDTLTTDGHEVTTETGGTHKCDGTNNGQNDTAGPTPTAALDDAAEQEGFTWDGEWYASFEDYFVSDIDGHNGGADHFWQISVNGTPTSVGGCQARIKAGDQVDFTWTEIE
ncbi:DUF4430 domain-containing protein [Streptomyces sp. NPDC005438]|uniref:DUF4430 domain-containing protein n=1 Tax=Streptomyces sp. NPDC005438 TaxID=3156880 RepID=UPI0033A5CC71